MIKSFLVEGGYGSSGLWAEILKKEKISFFTIDSGKSLLLTSHDGIAANLDDISTAFNLIDDTDLKFIIEKAKEELNKRVLGKDHFKISKISSSKEI